MAIIAVCQLPITTFVFVGIMLDGYGDQVISTSKSPSIKLMMMTTSGTLAKKISWFRPWRESFKSSSGTAHSDLTMSGMCPVAKVMGEQHDLG